MSALRIKKFTLKHPLIQAIIGLLIIILLIFYFKIFFTKGTYYDNIFLKKNTVSAGECYYSGRSAYGNIHIAVAKLKEQDNSIEVIYSLPNNIQKEYTVEFNKSSTGFSDSSVIIKENGKIAFTGEYRKDSMFLFNTNGESVVDEDELIQVQVNGENPYNSEYKIPLKNVVDIAYFANDTIRGKFVFLLFAVILFAITLIDIKFPLFFFKLRYFLDVRNPEPSDFYLFIQGLSRYVYPAIGIAFMIFAIVADFI
jgi:hypothetical protein